MPPRSRKRCDAPRRALGRRALLQWPTALAAARLTAPLLGAAGCGPSRSTSAAVGAPPPVASEVSRPPFGPLSLWSWFDLPEEPRSQELSGIAWDASTGALWAVQDNSPNVVSLVPDAQFERWRFGATLRIEADERLDLEGIASTADGFVLCSEHGPRVFEIDRAGKLRREVPIPSHFADARANKSLESLSVSPTGRFLFTTSEAALPRDGSPASKQQGSRHRILRLERTSGDATEHAYLTDPTLADHGDYGIADLAALSDHELLVLERGFAKGIGNTVRIYQVDLRDPRSRCEGRAALPASAPTLEKRLVVDLAALPAPGVPPAKQPQPSALLDNYEGLALGPRLPDGRHSVLLVSDDNARPTQVARVLVLAVG